MSEARITERLAAILSADAAGYSRLMGEDERTTITTLDACRAVFRQHIESQNGRVVDMAGDNVLAVFESASRAVQAALAIQKELAEKNRIFIESRRMNFRIGINLGEVMEKDDGTVYGDGVNIAARLQSLGEPGGICVSGSVHDQVEGKLPLAFKFMGEQAVKNIARPVRSYQLMMDSDAVAVPPSRPDRRRRTFFIGSVFLLTAIAIVSIAMWRLMPSGQVSGTNQSDPALAMPLGPAIAVLPFTNTSGDPSQDYFGDALTEDIITELARFRDLYVMARNTTFQYKGQTIDIPTVGRKLGVRYLLAGSVQRMGDHVRIAAQLIDAQTGAHLWADRYDRQLKDIFAVQDEIATKIVGAIASGFGGVITQAGRELAARKRPEQLQAYDHVMRASAFELAWTKDNYLKAKGHLEEAITLDPKYARARERYAWLMLIGWATHFDKGSRPPDELKLNALQAVALDPGDPLAHRTAAYGHFFDHKLDLFEREAKTAIELAPNNADVLAHMGLLLASSGQWERGVQLVTKANSLNPRSAGGWYHSALFEDFYRKGQYQKALGILREHPNPGLITVQRRYTAVYGELGDQAKAREHWNNCLAIDPAWSAKELGEHLRLWNIPDPVIRTYVQSHVKAGLIAP